MLISLDARSDVTELQKSFRSWHVESLVTQAAALVEQCLREYIELQSLVRSKKEFELQLDAEQYYIDSEQARAGAPQRGIDEAKVARDYLNNSDGSFQSSAAHARQLYTYWSQASAGGPGHIAAGQVVNEKSVQEGVRAMEAALAKSRIDWATADMTRETARVEALKKARTEKKAAAGAGNPLSLDESINLLKERLENTYRRSIERGVVAEVGLRDVYGYAQLAPNDDPLNPMAVVSKWAVWLRNATAFLAAQSMRDQGFIRVISLRALVEWNELKALGGETSHTFKFKLPEAEFSGHWNVRLRGIAASTIGTQNDYPWSLKVTVPSSAKFERPEGTSAVNQNMPSVYIGRVDSRNVNRSPDLCGGVSILNASPIASEGSEWTLMVSSTNADAQELESLSDIILELVCVGQPR